MGFILTLCLKRNSVGFGRLINPVIHLHFCHRAPGLSISASVVAPTSMSLALISMFEPFVEDNHLILYFSLEKLTYNDETYTAIYRFKKKHNGNEIIKSLGSMTFRVHIHQSL